MTTTTVLKMMKTIILELFSQKILVIQTKNNQMMIAISALEDLSGMVMIQKITKLTNKKKKIVRAMDPEPKKKIF